MNHSTTCKVCKLPLTVEIDDSYAALGGDPHNLIPMATCNRCFDYVTGKRDVRRRMIKLASELVFVRDSRPGTSTLTKMEGMARQYFRILSQQYARIISNYWHRPLLWMEDFTDQLMSTPDRIDSVLSGYERLYREQNVKETP